MYSRLITPARIHSWGDEDLLEATEQDRARIVQAAPVRRLQQKTQVFHSGRLASRRGLRRGLYQSGGDVLPAP